MKPFCKVCRTWSNERTELSIYLPTILENVILNIHLPDYASYFFPLQTLKNALSPYKLGGAAGGSDFDPKGKSDNEVSDSLLLIFTLSTCKNF